MKTNLWRRGADTYAEWTKWAEARLPVPSPAPPSLCLSTTSSKASTTAKRWQRKSASGWRKKSDAVAYSVVSYDNRRIDEMNILAATKACMADAVAALSVTPDVVIVDALKLDIPVRTVGIVHGDALSYSIAAASIIAKVERDAFMAEMDGKYPGYGFARNAGYGTAEHIAALRNLGPTEIHRRTFIKNFVGEEKR